MKKRLLVATLAFAALAPLAAHAGGGVVVSVSTPQFGFRIGSPFYGSPVYAPVYAPPVVVAPVVVAPPAYYRPPVQHAGYWVPSGHHGRYTGNHYR